MPCLAGVVQAFQYFAQSVCPPSTKTLLKQQIQNQNKFEELLQELVNKTSNIEMRQSMTHPTPGDSLRHADQVSRGEIWGANPEVWRQVAIQLDQEGIYSRGQMPCQADLNRGQHHALEELLRRAQLLPGNPAWSAGIVALANPRIQRLVTKNAPPELHMSPEKMDQTLGITPEMRQDLDQAQADAFPRYHHEPQDQVLPGDLEYGSNLQQMLPHRERNLMFRGRY